MAKNCEQAWNQSGQTKPYVSRLGSCQCCTLTVKISACNEFDFFGQFLDVYRKIFLTPLITSQNKAIRFCFSPTPLQLCLLTIIAEYLDLRYWVRHSGA